MNRRLVRGRNLPWYGFRGYTLHKRPGSTERGATGRAGLPARTPTAARHGPVAGCVPGSCWHTFPHTPQLPSGQRVWAPGQGR